MTLSIPRISAAAAFIAGAGSDVRLRDDPALGERAPARAIRASSSSSCAARSTGFRRSRRSAIPTTPTCIGELALRLGRRTCPR